MRRDEIAELLFRTPANELTALAAEALHREKGSHVHVRGLIEFSNRCGRNCLYCGLRGANRAICRYCLGQEEIMAAARAAVESGCDTIVLQSGEGAADPHRLAGVVAAIKSATGVAVTLGVGECPEWQYRLWRQAGADRFLLKHETSDADLYARLHPGHTLAARLACLDTLGRLGYEVGSGFIVGLPGQRPESLVDDILLAQDMGVDMCGAGPFIPQAQTPLAGCPRGSADLTLRVISVLRLALPSANLPATTALATVDPADGQKNGLLAGANVLMPGFTPPAAAASYRIYDSKTRVDMDAAIRAIEGAGRSHALAASALR